MSKINFIVVKKYKNKKADMYVFTDDGKEAIYPIFNDKNEMLKSSRIPLKTLLEQNGLSYSVEGLKNLRDLKLLHYMDENEFDRLHSTIKQGNENQTHHQKEKELSQQKMEKEKKPSLQEKWLREVLANTEQNPNLLLENSKNSYFHMESKQLPNIYKTISDYMPAREIEEAKINFIVIKKFGNKKAEMHVFMNDGKEAIYPITDDGKQVIQSSHAPLKKLAEQNGLSYSKEGLKKLKDLRVLHYMDEELFDSLYSVIKQENEDQISKQKEKKLARKAQFLKEHGLREADLDLDYSKVKPYVDCSEFASTDSMDNEDSKGKSSKRKLFLKERAKEVLEGVSLSKKGKKVGAAGSFLGATVVAFTLASAHNQIDTFDLKNDAPIASPMQKEAPKEKVKKKKEKAKETATPSPTATVNSSVETTTRYATGMASQEREYKNIMDALNNADINDKKKEHLSNVYSWLKFFNDSFANRYYSKKDDTKPAHRWDEVITDYLLFNNINYTTVYKIFDTTLLDSDQLMKSYKRGMKQDVQAYIISEESLKADQLIMNEKGKEYYKMYKRLFTKYKSLTDDSNYTKEEVANTFYKLVRTDFLMAGKEITPYKIAVLPIINAFYELSSDIDTFEKITKAELNYINQKVKMKAESRLEEYCNGVVVNKALYGEDSTDALSYAELKQLALKELKEKDNYNVESEDRDITNQKAYQKVMDTLNSGVASSDSDYDSYYKSMEEIKEPFRSVVAESNTENDKTKIKKGNASQEDSTEKQEKKTTQKKSSLADGMAKSMSKIMASKKTSEKGKQMVKRK